ncbi:MAG: penicillin-binding protein, partial [Litorimonas sp.]
TTNDHRDAWFAGYAPGLTAVVWVGNDDRTPMDRVTGGQIPARIFSDVMAAALAERPPSSLPQSAKTRDQVRAETFNALLDRLDAAVPSDPPERSGY